MSEINDSILDEVKEQAFNLLKNIEKYEEKFEDECKIKLDYNTDIQKEKHYKDFATEDYIYLLTFALEQSFKLEKNRLDNLKEAQSLKCGCGKSYKAPYSKCYQCLMKQRKNQTQCKCGKYFNIEGTNGATYKMCYSCNMEKKGKYIN